MNERIYTIAEQVGATRWNDELNGNSIEFSPEQLEKFAELIVQECCDWIEGSPTSESGCQLLLTKSFIIANLKGHFGV